MKYELNFCLASMIFLGIMIFFYHRQSRIPNRRNTYYSYLLGLMMITLIIEYISAGIEPIGMHFPIWFLYLANILMLLTTQLIAPLFLFYALIICGVFEKMSKMTRLLVIVPYIISSAFIVASPFTDQGIFHIDTLHIYRRSANYMVIYGVAVFYSAVIVLLSWLKLGKVSKSKTLSIVFFITMSAIAMVLQNLFPLYLVNTTACALSMVLMYHTLQSPSEHIDPLTEVLNRSAMNEIIQDLYEQRRDFSLVLFQLLDYHVINHTFGVRSGDALQKSFAEFLTFAYPNRIVVRASGDSYVLIDTTESIDQQGLNEIYQVIPHVWIINKTEIPLSAQLFGFRSVDFENPPDLQQMIEFAEHEHEENNEAVLMADNDFFQKHADRVAKEKALERTIRNNTVQVHYQPIYDRFGKLAAMEALARITDPEYGPLYPDDFIRIAEKNGWIVQLGEQILEKVCSFVERNDIAAAGVKHISVNLSVIQFMQNDLSERITAIMNAHHVGANEICFEITETERVVSQSTVMKNVQKLIDSGYKLVLDDFGSGFANFDYIATYPVSCVKIDKLLLWDAIKNPRQYALLAGIAHTINDLSLDSLCEGVETAEMEEMLRNLDVKLYQGYYYSKALPEEKVLAYFRDHNNNCEAAQ